VVVVMVCVCVVVGGGDGGGVCEGKGALCGTSRFHLLGCCAAASKCHTAK
jgi:hypothetical protein